MLGATQQVGIQICLAIVAIAELAFLLANTVCHSTLTLIFLQQCYQLVSRQAESEAWKQRWSGITGTLDFGITGTLDFGEL